LQNFFTISWHPATQGYEVLIVDCLDDLFDSYCEDAFGNFHRRVVVFAKALQSDAVGAQMAKSLERGDIALFVAQVNPDHVDLYPWYRDAVERRSYQGAPFAAAVEMLFIRIAMLEIQLKSLKETRAGYNGQDPGYDDWDSYGTGGLGCRLTPPPPIRSPGYAQPIP
jgi:hypothetical protein